MSERVPGTCVLPISEFGPFDLLADSAHAAYVHGFSERAVQLARDGLMIARLAGDEATVRYLTYTSGVALIEMGRNTEAVQVARDLLGSMDDSAGVYWKAKALAIFAEAVTRDGGTVAGLNALAEAYSLVHGTKLEVYNHVSAAHAVALALAPLQLFEPADELLLAAMNCSLGGPQTALFSAQEATLLRAVWGAALTLLGRTEEAERHYAVCASRALRTCGVAAGMGNAEMRARAQMMEGFAYQRLGNDALAESLLTRLLTTGPVREEVAEVQFARVGLAMALTSRGAHAEAREQLEIAIQAARVAGRFVLEQFALAAYAAVEEHEGGPHPAVERWRDIARSTMTRLWAERGSRFENLHNRIRIQSLADESARMTREVLEDPLTGVGNRRVLDAALAGSGSPSMSLMFVDIDRFKQVNDDYSHEVGDLVLRRLADILRAHCRADDMVVRYGGDEFLVLLATDGQDARAVAERIHAAVRSEPWGAIAVGLDVTVSLGVAAEVLAERALADADAALYAAKRAGRDRVVLA